MTRMSVLDRAFLDARHVNDWETCSFSWHPAASAEAKR
jgi:hypothetical protein